MISPLYGADYARALAMQYAENPQILITNVINEVSI